METFGDLLHTLIVWKPFFGGLLCLLGGILAVIGSVGVLRFPDFYTRLHAASITDTSAVLAMLGGMLLLAPHWLIVVKLLTIAIFLFLTGPTASHTIANAAHTAGLEPIIGRSYAEDDEEEEVY